MFWAIWVILLLLWIVALATGFTLSGYIHVLVIVAIVLLVIRLIQSKKIF
jgi:hypothetical protein